jgi:membrane associated rhomboid family serine protease
MTTDAPEPSELVEVGRYRRRGAANERGLVILAMRRHYWIFHDRDEYVLCVKARHRDAVLAELEKYEAERQTPRGFVDSFAAAKGSTVSLFVFAWVMALFFIAQRNAPPWWMERGEASNEAMLRGDWWRAVTALTLHADLQHFAMNLATGLVFAAFLVPMLGSGLAWTAIILSGALGNAINAWFYRGEPRFAIGASTAVFGALGIHVACQVVARLSSGRKPGKWEMIVPIGAGLALLAYLGAGSEGEHVDYMGHFWGFVAGNLFGAVIAALHLEKRASRPVQRALAALALALPAAAWAIAAAAK